MPSNWGQSWGSSWGNAWGLLAVLESVRTEFLKSGKRVFILDADRELFLTADRTLINEAVARVFQLEENARVEITADKRVFILIGVL